MKKVFLSALLLAGISATMTSCDNGDYTATPAGGTNWNPGTSGGVMSAKVNGTLWTASSGSFTATVNMVSGVSSDQKMMQITLGSYKGAGTYTIGTNLGKAQWMASQTDYAISTAGEVIVTSDANNKIQGTFHWEGNGITVTDGTFNVTKQ